jgi:hypothetical protein
MPGRLELQATAWLVAFPGVMVLDNCNGTVPPTMIVALAGVTVTLVTGIISLTETLSIQTSVVVLVAKKKATEKLASVFTLGQR